MTDKSIRLLVVENDAEDYLIIEKMISRLKKRHFELDRASSFQEAVEKIGRNIHDVCLLDYRLEGHDGLEFLRTVKDKSISIPVIFLTGQADYEVDLEAMQLGVADFLNKNKIDEAMLERSIRYALERRKADENRLRLASIVESSNDAIYTVDGKGVVLSWNPGAQKIYGYKPEEIGGRDMALLVSEGGAEGIATLLEKARQGQVAANFNTRHRTKNGREILLSVSLSPIKDLSNAVTRYSIIARDMTESEKAKAVQDMLQSERDQLLERLQIQMEKTPIACVLTDQDFNFTYWNPAAEKMFGYVFLEVEGKSLSMLAADPEKKEDEEILSRIRGGADPPAVLTRETKRKDGKAIFCEWYNTSLKDKEGRLQGLMAMVIDVTERRKTAEVQSQLAAILQQTSDAVVGTDLEGNIFSWNRGAEALFGYGLNEVIGHPASLLSPEDRQHEGEEMRDIVKSGENISNFETVRIRKDGGLIQVSITMSPIKDSRGRTIGVSSIHRDITEKKQAEESLRRHEEKMRQAEKMNAIGRLAGGVAHDFNNLLSVIGGNAEFLSGSLDKDSPHREEVEEIQKAVSRGAELTKQLLVFGQKQVSQPQPVDLNDLSAEMKKMLKRLIDANIDLSIIQDKDAKPILADPGQVQQIILNLVINARDAMPQGGHLILETRSVELQDLEKESQPSLPPGAYTRFSVTDSGTGMSPEIQKHIFEPFFTTKAAGKGTGLGLATVYGLVGKWNGHIFVHSTPGMGTTFTLYFPAMVSVEGFEVKPKQISLIPEGTETILLAEDEEPVRKVLVRTLERYGYKVLEAANGLEGIQKAWDYSDTIHLLLTDTIMPKMNGKELADEIKKTRPKTKVIFISGYPKEVLSQQGILHAGIHLIQKPFELEDLARQVRKTLDEK